SGNGLTAAAAPSEAHDHEARHAECFHKRSSTTEDGRPRLQALVRRRHNALVDCAPSLPFEYARHFVSVLSSCTALDGVLSPGKTRTSVFLESNAVSTR